MSVPFVTGLNQPLRILVFLVTVFNKPLLIMSPFVMVECRYRYGPESSNGLYLRPLLLLIISNGRCGGVVRLGPARIIGNARCLWSVTVLLLCNGLLEPVTNAVLPI